jgi:hypothetical protein
VKGWKRITEEARRSVKGPAWVCDEDGGGTVLLYNLANALNWAKWYIPADVPPFDRHVEFPVLGPWSTDLDALRAHIGKVLVMMDSGSIYEWRMESPNHDALDRVVAWCPILKRGRV